MDIFEHLKKDHRKVSELMEKLSSSEAATVRVQLFGELKEEILKHAKAEEATFYNFLDGHEEMEDIIAEAREDHQMVETLIHEIEALDPAGKEWMDRFDELKESVDDHIDQEENEIFEEARELIGTAEADELDRRMTASEQQITPAT